MPDEDFLMLFDNRNGSRHVIGRIGDLGPHTVEFLRYLASLQLGYAVISETEPNG